MRLVFLLLMSVVACSGSGTAGPHTAQDAQSSDVSVLPEATVLEPGAPDLFGSAGPDSLSEEHDVQVISDVSQWPDANETGPQDLGFAKDSADLPDKTSEPEQSAKCGPTADPCPPGYSCLVDPETGKESCTFVAECSEEGAIDAYDLIKFLSSPEAVYVKVKASVTVGQAACSVLPCPEERPCCNLCFAPLVINVAGFQIVLLGQGIPFGCQGTECDYGKNCSPLKPGSCYLIWGFLGLFGGKPELHVESFCPFDMLEQQ